jgi:hypothetical protein
MLLNSPILLVVGREILPIEQEVITGRTLNASPMEDVPSSRDGLWMNSIFSLSP